MLSLLLFFAAWGAEGAWPPSGPRQAVDSGPRRDSVARARPSGPLLPALWSNDYGGVTLGLRARAPRSGDAVRGLLVASAATRGGTTSAVSLYGRWNNPLAPLQSRAATSVAVWSVEGPAGAAITLGRSLRRPRGGGADQHGGGAARWRGTTNPRYLDPPVGDDPRPPQI